MRRAMVIAIPVVCLLAGCGGKTVAPVADTVVGTLPQSTVAAGPKLPTGDAAKGKTVFASSSCGGCHTLKAAGTSGTVGPNLDELKPALEAIQHQVINGGGGMPPYKGTLTEQQIADVSQYVFESTHGSASG
jgi:mono/diheme cytochrome c family protein